MFVKRESLKGQLLVETYIPNQLKWSSILAASPSTFSSFLLTRKHIPLISLFPCQISESKLCSSSTFPPRWSSSVKTMDPPSSLHNVLLINVDLSIFLSTGNRAILSPWPAGWSLNAWTKSYKINNVWWQSTERFKYSGGAKYRQKL